MEYLSLYDNEGNVVEEKGIRGVDSKYLKGIVIIFIENSKGEFLIQMTSKSRESVYATTGGHVDYGDTFDNTVVKEVYEELGIDISKDNIIEICDVVAFNHYYERVYYLKKDIDINELTLKKDEVEYVKWFSINEILDLIKENKFRDGNIEGFMNVLSKYHKEYLD